MQPRALALLVAALALPLGAGAAAADSLLDIVQAAPEPIVAYVGEMTGGLGGSAGEGATALVDQALAGSGMPLDGDALRASADSIAAAMNTDLQACPSGVFVPAVNIPWAPDHVPSVDGGALQATAAAWLADPGNASEETTCRTGQVLTLGDVLPAL